MPEWVSPLEVLTEAEAARFGHKAVTLAALARAGFNIPPGFAISADAFSKQAELLLGPAWREKTLQAEELERFRELFIDRAPPGELGAAVADAFSKMSWKAETLLAVRSSATTEDAPEASAAGIQDSLLGVKGIDGILKGIQQVWASMWTERARTYRESGPAKSRNPAMGVLVQELLAPDAAGALFTVNPVTGERGELLINSTFGLGEPVLSGSVAPDTFVLDKGTLSLTTTSIAMKSVRVDVRAEGLETSVLTPAEGRKASLDAAQCRSVAKLGLEIERHAGAPRDVEWALVGDEVYLLQSRPVTACAEPCEDASESADDEGRGDVWTNANVGEALPGVATPLTWSIAARYSERGFRSAFGALGCDVPDGAVLVGQFRGRIFLNLSQFVSIAGQVPLLGARSLAELGGARWPDDVPPPVSGGFRLSIGFLRRLPKTIVRLVRQNVFVERKVAVLEQRVTAISQRLRRTELITWSDARLGEELEKVDELLTDTGDSMLTCAASSLGSYQLLSFLLEHWVEPSEPGLERELLSGAADLESARPGVALWHIAEELKGDSDAVGLLLEREPEELQVALFSEQSRVRRELEGFLAAFGYRAVREAELMTPRWSEDPSLIFATLREYVRSGGPPPGRALEERLEARRIAWGRVERQVGPLRLKVVRRLVELARRYHRLRERLRARVTEVLGLYRTIALDVSRRLNHPDAAFFLTIVEVHRYLREGRVNNEGRGLGPLIAARRRAYELEKSLPDPPATFVGSPPADEAPLDREERNSLQGVGASPGLATGEARVLSDQADAGQLRAGEILVVSCADIGWSPMFLLAGALVTELGGVLSHAAVVAREYGVPAVVSVRDATRYIQNGQQITVDGNSGLVTLHPV